MWSRNEWVIRSDQRKLKIYWFRIYLRPSSLIKQQQQQQQHYLRYGLAGSYHYYACNLEADIWRQLTPDDFPRCLQNNELGGHVTLLAPRIHQVPPRGWGEGQGMGGVGGWIAVRACRLKWSPGFSWQHTIYSSGRCCYFAFLEGGEARRSEVVSTRFLKSVIIAHLWVLSCPVLSLVSSKTLLLLYLVHWRQRVIIYTSSS